MVVDRRQFLAGSGAGLIGAALSTGTVDVNAAIEKRGVALEKPADDIMGDLQFSTKEFERRYSNIQAAMAEEKLDCLVITGSADWYRSEDANLNYITGKQIRLEPAFVVLPKTGSPVSIHKSSLFLKKPMNLGNAPVEIEPSPIKPGSGNAADYGPAVVKLIKKMGYAKGKIGLVPMRLTPASTYLEIAKECPHAEIVDAESLMVKLRRVKSAEEIRFLRRSGYMADVAVQALIEAVEPGITEHELILAAEHAMVMHGGKPGGFQLLQTGKWKDFGPGLGQGSFRKLENGELVLSELTSNYKGYFTQLAVPVSLGDPDPQFQLLMKTCGAVLEAQLPIYRPGVETLELDQIGDEIAKEVSGGVFGSHFSLQTMDFSQSFLHPHFTLEAGNVHAVMPWIHANGSGKFIGHAFGNTLVCTDGEPLVLNKSNLDLVVV